MDVHTCLHQGNILSLQARAIATPDCPPEATEPTSAGLPARQPPQRQSRRGHQSVWLFGRHAVLAALANPERRIERLFATRKLAERHAAEIGKTTIEAITSREDLSQRLPDGAVHQGIAALVAPLEEPHASRMSWPAAATTPWSWPSTR